MPKTTSKPSPSQAPEAQIAELQKQVAKLKTELSAVTKKYLVILKSNIKLRGEIDELKIQNKIDITTLRTKFIKEELALRKRLEAAEESYLDYVERYAALLAKHIKLKQATTH